MTIQEIEQRTKDTAPNYFSAKIQWHDDKTICYNMLLKIGDIEDDDDDIFFYLEDKNELEEAYKDDFAEWKILQCIERGRIHNLD